MGEIYLITNVINNKQYVGQTISGYKVRWKHHVKEALYGRGECRLLANAIRKYGKDNFHIESIHECEMQELNDLEVLYIREYNTICPMGYNLMSGGGNGRKHHQETKERMSRTRTGKKHKDITKRRIGDAHKGKAVSTNTRTKIGKASKYRNMSSTNKSTLRKALNKIDLCDLPIYIAYSIDKRIMRYGPCGVEVIQVRVPGKKSRKFGKKNMPLSEKIRLAIGYKNSCT